MAVNAAIVNSKSNVYDGVMTEEEWSDETKRLLRAEMTRRGVTYEQLSEKLAAIGINDTSVNIRNKVARGRFSAAFLIQCLTAMGAQTLRLTQSD
jgi:hypothetical protein